MAKVTAIIPAKGTSVRVPNKNMRKIDCVPLVQRKIDALNKCEHVDEVVVGTDNEDIAALARECRATVLYRDPRLCDEARSCINESLRDLASRVGADTILWAHCTNPLVRPSTFDAALEVFDMIVDKGVGDSVVSVTHTYGHFWTPDSRRLNFVGPAYPHPLGSELPPVISQDRAIFIQSRKQMIQNAYFYGVRPALFKVDTYEGWDINTEEDLVVAEALLRYREG